MHAMKLYQIKDCVVDIGTDFSTHFPVPLLLN